MTGYNLVMDTSQEALVSALASHNLGTMDQDTKILDSRKKMKPLQATNVDSKLTKDQKLKTKVSFCYIFSSFEYTWISAQSSTFVSLFWQTSRM